MKLEEILNSVNPEYEEEVKSICDKWKKKVQEGLKDMMRFGMPKDIRINFDVNTAYPDYFSNIIFNEEEYKKYILYQNRYDIISLEKFLIKFINLYNDNFPFNLTIDKNLEEVKNLVEDVIKLTPSDDEFYNKIKNFNKDILGVYRIRKRHFDNNLFSPIDYLDFNNYDDIELSINLFWTVIGLFSERYGLNLEAVTVAILSHEYAHAYSHIGIDANDRNWLTSDFILTEKCIKEGIAEYFSKKFMEENNDSLNKFSETYNILLEKSPKIYKEYEKWKNPSLEAIRFVMLQIRNNKGITSNHSFLQILSKGKNLYP